MVNVHTNCSYYSLIVQLLGIIDFNMPKVYENIIFWKYNCNLLLYDIIYKGVNLGGCIFEKKKKKHI